MIEQCHHSNATKNWWAALESWWVRRKLLRLGQFFILSKKIVWNKMNEPNYFRLLFFAGLKLKLALCTTYSWSSFSKCMGKVRKIFESHLWATSVFVPNLNVSVLWCQYPLMTTWCWFIAPIYGPTEHEERNILIKFVRFFWLTLHQQPRRVKSVISCQKSHFVYRGMERVKLAEQRSVQRDLSKLHKTIDHCIDGVCILSTHSQDKDEW